MSAPSLLTRPYAAPQPAFATGYSSARCRPTPPRTGHEYSESLDAVDRLALSLADLCRSAVDPLAIVAGLEAEGYNDGTARERFALPDLFALAEELHRRVPIDLDPPRPSPPSAPTGTARAILRGLLFATPSLSAMAFLVADVNGFARVTLAVVQVLAWGYGQGVAHLAYARLNSADQPSARRILRVGTVHALLICVSLLGGMELMLGTPLTALVPAALSLWFSLAAIPALVLGAEYQLAATLGPAVLGAVATAFGASAGVALAGSQVSTATAITFMLWLTRTEKTVETDVTQREMRDLVPHALAGLGIGALITVVLAGPITTGHGLIALHATIVLTLSMGVGEWHARWYQRHVSLLLFKLADPAQFPPRATRLLMVALLRETATASMLAGAAYLLFDRDAPGALGLYLYTVALAPGLLAVLFLRGIDAKAALWPIGATLIGTVVALPSHDIAILTALAAEFTALATMRAAHATARPWVHL
jgi:hypothetical protein